MTIDVYLAPVSAPCRAVLMAAKHFGVDVNAKEVDLMKGEQNKPEYLKMNPQHCVPTIDDNGFYLWESRAILTYLANKYAPESSLYPKDPQKRAVVDRMLFFDMGTLYKAQGDLMYPQLFKGEAADPEKDKAYKTALGLLEGFLEKTPYVAGDELSLADLSILGSLTFTEILDYDFSSFPKIQAWLAKLKNDLPYYKEINEQPIAAFKEFLKQKKGQ